MVRTVRTSSKRQYGKGGRRPQLQLASGVPLTGIRAEVAEIIASVPVDPNTRKAQNQKIIGALRAAGFRVRKYPGGFDVQRIDQAEGGGRTFFKFKP